MTNFWGLNADPKTLNGPQIANGRSNHPIRIKIVFSSPKNINKHNFNSDFVNSFGFIGLKAIFLSIFLYNSFTVYNLLNIDSTNYINNVLQPVLAIEQHIFYRFKIYGVIVEKLTICCVLYWPIGLYIHLYIVYIQT